MPPSMFHFDVQKASSFASVYGAENGLCGRYFFPRTEQKYAHTICWRFHDPVSVPDGGGYSFWKSFSCKLEEMYAKVCMARRDLQFLARILPRYVKVHVL